MSEYYKNIPEVIEFEIGTAITTRNEAIESFKDLGPIDLVHVVKTLKKENREIGSYHMVQGVDCSSIATIAAYLNTLTYAMDDSAGWFSKPQWKVTSGVFCCYNAFSRVDLRVEIHIPGGVDAYVIDEKGNRYPATADVLQESFVSSVLRSIWSQDDYLQVPATRRLSPLQSEATESKFLEAAKAVFWQGVDIGAPEQYQFPTKSCNYLSLGIKKYFCETQRAAIAAAFFSELVSEELEIAGHVADCYFHADDEIKGLKILNKSLRVFPNNAVLLESLANFLKSKDCIEDAIDVGNKAVKALPLEFIPWEQLCMLYVAKKDFRKALIIMNACPNWPYNHVDNSIRFPPPAKVHIPSKDGILESSQSIESEIYGHGQVDPTLQKLVGSQLRGITRKVYSLLSKLTLNLGWEDLLQLRIDVFVMDEEYRQFKHVAEKQVTRQKMEVFTPVEPPAKEVSFENTLTAHNEEKDLTEVDHDDIKNINLQQTETLNKSLEELKIDTNTPSHSRQGSKVVQMINNKRLCERWLDMLFMTLYEDLKVYTIWKAEAQHYKMQNTDYRRSQAEWEILGDLALRLDRIDDAKEAYHNSLELSSSMHSWTQLVEIYTNENKISHALNAAAQLAVHYEKIYQLNMFPNLIGKCIFTLIRANGLLKVKATLSSATFTKHQLELLLPFIKSAEDMKINGFDY
ncbi:chaps-domain-containing protein [Rozella allomycis CSF55]|uniref:Chaps-domain-containing protein n=1 Tax=Rozella allomycis (strain CSF55) TaxID=988480 RepID=A0A4P9YR25_ROZAC|nr:chaps-domain-containing protein [Rozella allomycis CSF55]